VADRATTAARKICSQFPDDYWMQRDEDHEFPWEFYAAMVRGGWLGLTIPEEYGGGGLGVTEAAIVEQEIAASGAGSLYLQALRPDDARARV
jgi:acyl-CoA dehydrogenase